METKFIYGLSWRNDGYGEVLPQSATLAVSNDKEKLMKMMRELVEKDCKEIKREDYGEDWEYEEVVRYNKHNFKVLVDHGEEVVLTHRINNEICVTYEIETIEVI